MEHKDLTVLITGARGQIGSAMARLLDEQGIAHLDLDLMPADGKQSYLSCDLADPNREALASFCRPVTHVIHLASKISRSKNLQESYLEQYRLNVLGTWNLLEALQPSLRHIALASTMTIYGDACVPDVSENEPENPNCIYALCKLAVERHLRYFSRRTGIPVAFLRYSSAYGPGSAPGRAIPCMIERILNGQAPEVYGDGSVKRDYIYLDDLCRATLISSLKEASGIFNIGTGIGTSSAELAQTLIRLSGRSLEPVFIAADMDGQARSSMVYDTGKARRELDFVPRVSLEEGLRRTLNYFESLRGGVLV